MDELDLDRLADELEHAGSGAPGISGSGLDEWLRLIAAREASDLFLLAGEPPAMRINGRVVRSSAAVLDGADVEELVLSGLPAHAQRAFRETGIADASVKLAGVGRFRVNLHRERSRAAAVIRMLPKKVPSFAQLELPAGT